MDHLRPELDHGSDKFALVHLRMGNFKSSCHDQRVVQQDVEIDDARAHFLRTFCAPWRASMFLNYSQQSALSQFRSR